MVTDADILDLTVSQRQATFVWELLDAQGIVIGNISPQYANAVPSVSVETSQALMRQLDGVILSPSDTAAVNPITDRLRPSMVLGNGSSYPLGVFVFSAVTDAYPTWGHYLSGSLTDLAIELQQAIGYAYNLAIGDDIYNHLNALAGISVLNNWQIDPTGAQIGAAVSYTADETILTILNDLAVMAAMFPVYVDNRGRPCLTEVKDPTPAPTLVYSSGQNIYRDTLYRSSNLVSSPNQWIVTEDTGHKVLVGKYDLPATAPNSFAQRGYYVTSSSTVSGLGTQDDITAAAKALARQQASFSTWTWSGAPDPRHDTFDDVDLTGTIILETAWSMSLSDGEAMTHTGVTRWSDTDVTDSS